MKTVSRNTWTDANGVRHVNDIRIVNGSFDIVSGDMAKAQIIEAAVRTRIGEMALDNERGLPYFGTIFTSRVYADDLKEALKERIEELDFVSAVVSLDAQIERDGIFAYQAKIALKDGTVLEV